MEKANLDLAEKIKRYIESGKHPLIILISGVNGVGKTTIAFQLSNILEIKQRVGLGSIVKTLISMRPKDKALLKMDNHFSSPINITNLQKQSLIISKPLNLIIRSYSEGGVSCVIEGVQLLPRYLDKQIMQFHILVADSKKYRNQLKNCNTRNPREVSDKEFSNLLNINEILKEEMNFPTVYILDNSKSLVAIINEILYNLAIKLNIK